MTTESDGWCVVATSRPTGCVDVWNDSNTDSNLQQFEYQQTVRGLRFSFCRAMLCISAACAVVRCLSV